MPPTLLKKAGGNFIKKYRKPDVLEWGFSSLQPVRIVSRILNERFHLPRAPLLTAVEWGGGAPITAIRRSPTRRPIR